MAFLIAEAGRVDKVPAARVISDLPIPHDEDEIMALWRDLRLPEAAIEGKVYPHTLLVFGGKIHAARCAGAKMVALGIIDDLIDQKTAAYKAMLEPAEVCYVSQGATR